jgi:hypothetical protein
VKRPLVSAVANGRHCHALLVFLSLGFLAEPMGAGGQLAPEEATLILILGPLLAESTIKQHLAHILLSKPHSLGVCICCFAMLNVGTDSMALLEAFQPALEYWKLALSCMPSCVPSTLA